MVEAVTLQWLTTNANPHVKVNSFNPDGGAHGWKLHAIEAEDKESFAAIKNRLAACGLMAAHGWGLDLFIDKKCARCLRKTGLACSLCRGTGRIKQAATQWTDPCPECRSTGQNKESLREEQKQDRVRELALARQGER